MSPERKITALLFGDIAYKMKTDFINYPDSYYFFEDSLQIYADDEFKQDGLVRYYANFCFQVPNSTPIACGVEAIIKTKAKQISTWRIKEAVISMVNIFYKQLEASRDV